MKTRGHALSCVRCRRVRGKTVEGDPLRLNDLTYQAGSAENISFHSSHRKMGPPGFIRFVTACQKCDSDRQSDLDNAALIREVHVRTINPKSALEKTGAAQHTGLGTRLLEEAENALARKKGFSRIKAVISAIGTRQYYMDRGFERGGEYYLVKKILNPFATKCHPSTQGKLEKAS
ncbi:MAG: hypothetical protein IPJ46_22720 [Anaerolineales bacterium]|nr:hypothetical protein [Anaerolineales bacterium]